MIRAPASNPHPIFPTRLHQSISHKLHQIIFLSTLHQLHNQLLHQILQTKRDFIASKIERNLDVDDFSKRELVLLGSNRHVFIRYRRRDGCFREIERLRSKIQIG